MRSSDTGTEQLRFGLFEVDLANAELRKQGRKVALQDQPFRVLTLLLQQPGRTVTREELHRSLWGPETFVSFEESLNKAVQKLRHALDDSPENPRFIQTVPRQGYRFIAPVQVVDRMAAAPPEARGYSSFVRSGAITLIAAAVLIAAGFATTRLLSRRSGPRLELKLTQLTTDTGLTFEPAISPDGKLITYASDRSGEGTLDIWVQQIPRGEPIRVTHHEADDHEPSFSPDGQSIVFRSERLGGGIYVVPALGGAEAKKIADGGRGARYSPDGASIAYWTGRSHFGEIYVTTAGGPPRRVSDSRPGRSPVWSPDGSHILFAGLASPTECDWYVAPINGGPAVKTGATAFFHDRGMYGTELTYPHPDSWIKDGSAVLFSAKLGDSTELWKVPISRDTWKVSGEPQRMLSGPGIYRYPSASAAGPRIVFSSLTRNADIWSVPVGPNSAVNGGIKQLTHNASDDISPSVSADGTRLVFESTRSGKRVVWAKDLETGAERPLSEMPSAENFPTISPDGSQVVYQVDSAASKSSNGLYVVGFDGGTSRQVCDDNCYLPWQWSVDNRRIFYGSDKDDIGVLDVRTGSKTILLKSGECSFWGRALAPNEKWISFEMSCRSEKQSSRFIAPVRDGRVNPKHSWLPDAGGRWSPDANAIYAISEKDGFVCLYVQRSDRATQGPAGQSQVAHHFHAARQSLIRVPEIGGGSVARDKIVITLVESTGNIWMAEELNR
jgi:eukaryotic-like serine/threonine-protein kinase